MLINKTNPQHLLIISLFHIYIYIYIYIYETLYNKYTHTYTHTHTNQIQWICCIVRHTQIQTYKPKTPLYKQLSEDKDTDQLTRMLSNLSLNVAIFTQSVSSYIKKQLWFLDICVQLSVNLGPSQNWNQSTNHRQQYNIIFEYC